MSARSKLRFLAVVWSLGVVLSCRFGSADADFGTLRIDFASSNSRIVHPFASDELIKTDHYIVTLTDPAGQPQTPQNVLAGSNLELSYIAAGLWRIAAQAVNADGQILGGGSAEALVSPGSLTAITLSIQVQGTGNLAIVLITTGNGVLTPNHAYKAWYKKAGESSFLELPLVATVVGVEGSVQASSGIYTGLTQIADNLGRVVWGKIDTFYIYENLTSRKEWPVLAAEMNAPPESAPEVTSVERVHDQVRLSWRGTTGRTETYRLERRQGAGAWATIATLGATVQDYVDSSLTPATSYSYRLRSENSFGEGPYCEEVVVQTANLVAVNGLITGEKTWTRDTVYQCIGNTQVATGARLTIESGVKIMIDNGKFFQVAGELVARGNTSDPVVFGYRSAGWSNLQFLDSSMDAVYVNGAYSSGTILENALVTGGGYIWIGYTNPLLRKVMVENYGGWAIQVRGLSYEEGKVLKITDSIIKNCNEGIGLWSANGKVEIARNSFSIRHQGVYGESSWGEALVADNAIQSDEWGQRGVHLNSSGNWAIRNNLIRGNNWHGDIYGILLESCSNVTIDGNDIAQAYHGISLNWNGNAVKTKNNVIHDCTYGMNVHVNGESHEIRGNIIRDNGTRGLYCHGGYTLTSLVLRENYLDNPACQYEVVIDKGAANGVAVLDMSDNYWWTNDPFLINERIYDHDADVLIGLGNVKIEPVATLTGVVTRPSAPLDGVVLTDSGITFNWTTLGRAATYRLEVAADAGFGTPVLDKAGLTTTSYKLGNTEYGLITQNAPYWWRVRATGNDGTEYAASATRSFTLVIPAPALADPVDGETLYEDWSPRFEWLPSSSAERFHLMVDDDPAFGSPVIDLANVDAAWYEPMAELTPSTTYWWKVVAIDGNGVEGVYSAVYSVTLPEPGLRILFQNKVPGYVGVTLSGPAEIMSSQFGQTGLFQVWTGKPATSLRWYLNGALVHQDLSLIGTTSFAFPTKPASVYRLTVEAVADGSIYCDEMMVRVIVNTAPVLP